MRKYARRNYNHLRAKESKHVQISIDDINEPPKIFVDGKNIRGALISIDYKYRTNDENIQPHSFEVAYYKHGDDTYTKRTIVESNLY
ncbi:hypothetical protein ACLHK8_01435 [Pediococcus sp. M21F004]|uniref:hypothetical protein n=1 Tax=Pediococcus sp. M21F004 TaxID=3390033 RepID=UPI003DA6D16B